MITRTSSLVAAAPPPWVRRRPPGRRPAYGTVTLGTPLAAGAPINVRFRMGLQQTGNDKLYLNIEALP